MIIVGELINASRKTVKSVIENRDHNMLRKLAMDQAVAGADYIDVNAGIFVAEEAECLKWSIENILNATDNPCCIDTPNPSAMETALAFHQEKTDKIPMINSISLEKNRFEPISSIIAGTDFKVVALCVSDDGMPTTAEQRISVADKLINSLVKKNVKLENIYVDPLVQAISTDSIFGMEFLKSVNEIMTRFEGVHTMCGLSNISFGMPERKFLNRTFMAMAIACGLDGAIVDPLDEKMMANIITAEALVGRDDFCTAYLKAFRAGKIQS
ncbi:MAG: dihydropteroate synthase [Desulfobacteraceae bacterium]|nr:dihydropteroate synthase [Desulfobacteraceae bacterium]MBC2756389.1 dihydropteroate synthase [Desulfobacteraceae bacterium]